MATDKKEEEPTEQEMDEYTSYLVEFGDMFTEQNDTKGYYVKASDEDSDTIVALCLGEQTAITVSESINGFHDAVEKIIFIRDLTNVIGHKPEKALAAIKHICDTYMREWAMFSKHWAAGDVKEEAMEEENIVPFVPPINGATFRHDD